MVRLFSLRDVLAVKQLEPKGVAFDLRRLLTDIPSPAQSALLGYLTRHRLGATTCVYESPQGKHRLAGFAQIWPRENRAEWDLVYLSPSLDNDVNAATIWRQLLPQLTVLGALNGALRIHVRSTEDVETEDLFRQVGYAVVSREEIFAFSQTPVRVPLPKGLRPVSYRDGYGLEELYYQALPQVVRQAHGFASWEDGSWRHVPLSYTSFHEYVWAEKDKVLAHLVLYSSERGHWLEVVVRPEHRADILPHIKYMLTLAPRSVSTQIYCAVPDHGVGLGWLLRTLGFASYTRQVLLVVHTAACARVGQKRALAGLERGVDIGTPVGHASQRIISPKSRVG